MIEPKLRHKKEFSPGTILRGEGHVRIVGYSLLPEQNRSNLHVIFNVLGLQPKEAILEDGQDIEFAEDSLPIGEIGRAVKTGFLNLEKIKAIARNEEIDFRELFDKAKRFADFLDSNTHKIRDALRHYETNNVVLDEIRRSTEHLRNLDKNREYFQQKTAPIATFMPLNQPLYALVCFGIVPAMMCKEAYVRPPAFAQETFKSLQSVLNLHDWFENLHISYEPRAEFVERTKKIVGGVIFVGSPENTAKVRRIYPADIMFLANGSGHNPVVIGQGADLDKAVQSVMNVALYNQGQDCCGPNTILVDAGLCNEFMDRLLQKIKAIEPLVGPSENDQNIVGPNTDKTHTIKVAEIFVRSARYHIYGGDINPASGLIRPTVFLKPLSEGANYEEFFAPVFHVQPYSGVEELRQYFLSEQYRQNAMYLTLYGQFDLEEELVQAGLHDSSNIIKESDLHKEEKGFKPYGGLGPDASCIYFEGRKKPSGILPQREIYTYMVKRTKLLEQNYG